MEIEREMPSYTNSKTPDVRIEDSWKWRLKDFYDVKKDIQKFA